MRIVIDAMGGDHAPGEIVAGAVQASREHGVEVIFAGPEDRVRAELNRHDVKGLRLDILPAPETIGFDEPPVQAVRKKKESSLVRGIQATREGLADAFVSAGSTGAIMAGGLLLVGRIKGIDRPALSAVLPTRTRFVLLLDVGANADCSPQNLLQFAHMGAIYAERVLKVADPKVGLLNIGVEEQKGNELTRAALTLLRESKLRFVGNVEARDVPEGVVDVVVADGFSGNILLKSAEGIAKIMVDLLKAELARTPLRRLAALVLRPGLRAMAVRMDYSEYGGATLLGVDAPLFKCHGSSRSRAIMNGVRVAAEFVEQNCLQQIKEDLG